MDMKLTISLKLLPTPSQADALRRTMAQFNAACNAVSGTAFALKTSSRTRLHHACYYRIRAEFGLASQRAVRAMGVVCAAYRRDKKTLHSFRPDSALVRDNRLLSYKRLDRVSILTMDGRQVMAFVCGDYNTARKSSIKGEADLVFRDGKWFLLQTVHLPDPPITDTDDFIGVDLGLTHIAVDSDGIIHSGKGVKSVRARHQHLRTRLQSLGTKSAKGLLKKRRRKETRFMRDVNPCLSKTLVATAQRTGRGMALEDLKGIGDRIRVRQPQRRLQHSWAFYQLRSFIEYKARLSGVMVVAVDPRNTSRTCPVCGHCEKANRRSQAQFLCVSCGHAGLADSIAAQNIRRAAINRPIVDNAFGVELQTPLLATG